jgi:hypothetical protein
VSRCWLAALLFATAGCDTSGFRDAYMALDSEGNRERERFFTDTEAIFCIAKMASGVDDVTVRARLLATTIYDPRDGTPKDVDHELAISEEAPGRGEDITVSFELKRDGTDAPYVAGRFVCELAIDGKVEERVKFEVALPDCPEAPIFSRGVCAGFVLEGARCAGALGGECECTEGLWSCK